MILNEDLDNLSCVCEGLLSRWTPEVDYVKSQIKDACAELLREGWTEDGGEPHWGRVLNLDGCVVRIALMHGRKGEHITGADLAFEVRNKKIVLVQAKRVGPAGRLSFNRLQMQKLLELESQLCASSLDPSRAPCSPGNLFTDRARVWCRVAYYHLIMGIPSQPEERYYHVPEVSFVLGQRKSCSQHELRGQGLTPEGFRDLFWRCRIGGPDLDDSIKSDVFWYYSILTDRLVLWVDVRLP